MPDFASELTASPALYPQKYDPARDSILFISLSQDDYHAASFLDDRVFTPGMEVRVVARADVDKALETARDLRPLHFIFHTGHVGSTLLSRLIDATGVTLGLREPVPLRTLAELADAGSPVFDARLTMFLKLWSRGFPSTNSVVLKATSSTGRIAPKLLAASPGSKAIYLNLKAEPYLATLLAGPNTINDLRGFEVERRRRLETLLGVPPPAATGIGELAATSWLAETLTQRAALDAGGDRVLPLDFEDLLANVEATMVKVLDHFWIGASANYRATIARSPVLTRYSKAPKEHAYSTDLRAQLLAQTRREQGSDIRKGLSFIETLAKEHPRVAAVL